VLDLKIEGVTVIDGTGTAGFRADVGIRDERIAAIGDLSREPTGTLLNASGLTLAPGFIDMHSHTGERRARRRAARVRALPPEGHGLLLAVGG
jgi:N-acyl-D-aspartate/D-glutamate deacylase